MTQLQAARLCWDALQASSIIGIPARLSTPIEANPFSTTWYTHSTSRVHVPRNTDNGIQSIIFGTRTAVSLRKDAMQHVYSTASLKIDTRGILLTNHTQHAILICQSSKPLWYCYKPIRACMQVIPETPLLHMYPLYNLDSTSPHYNTSTLIQLQLVIIL